MKKIKGTLAVFFLFLIVLSGCSFGNHPAKKMYDHLEKAVSVEQGFVKYQKQLIQKEEKEQNLYGEIIKLNMNQFDRIVSLSKQASKLAGERKQLIQKEKKVLDQAYDEFSKVKPIAKKINKPKLKKKADALITVMDKRYQTYNDLYTNYIKSIGLDQQLYQMLQKKDLKPGTLKKQIDKINAQYKEIDDKKQAFNQYTKQYNDTKKSFYKAAGLHVKIDKGKEQER